MENIDSLDVLIETVKYTSEIIINITEKINNMELKIKNIEEIVNDQIKINNKNTKTIEYHDKLIKELFKKNNEISSHLKDDIKSTYKENDKTNNFNYGNDTESVIDFNIIREKEYNENTNQTGIEKSYNLINEDNSNHKTDILIEKLINHKKNLDNQINKEQNDYNSKKISTETVTRTTPESLINRRKTNAFRKI
jgi:hypothetical protein